MFVYQKAFYIRGESKTGHIQPISTEAQMKMLYAKLWGNKL